MDDVGVLVAKKPPALRLESWSLQERYWDLRRGASCQSGRCGDVKMRTVRQPTWVLRPLRLQSRALRSQASGVSPKAEGTKEGRRQSSTKVLVWLKRYLQLFSKINTTKTQFCTQQATAAAGTADPSLSAERTDWQIGGRANERTKIFTNFQATPGESSALTETETATAPSATGRRPEATPTMGCVCVGAAAEAKKEENERERQTDRARPGPSSRTRSTQGRKAEREKRKPQANNSCR